MTATGKSVVLTSLILASFVVIGTTLWLRPVGPPPSGSEQNFIEQEEFRRLKSVKVEFTPARYRVVGGEGRGEHHGGKPPVTAHPLGPAFGPGVKVAMSDAEFFQFFQAYQSPKHPVFVTSDSLIQAYFGVLRKELIRLEAVDGWNLRDAVVDALKKVDGTPINGPGEVVAAARRLARINLAIVARLFDSRATPLQDPADEAIVKEEAERVERAEGAHLPRWLHVPADDLLAVHYPLFRPTGDRPSELAKRRFRAFRWLQSVPWRIDRDDHLLATLLAARATDQGGAGTALRDPVCALMMPPDDVDAFQLLDWYGTGPLETDKLTMIRNEALKKLAADPPRLNDVLRFPPNARERPTARWRSAGRMADLVALDAVFGQNTPNGLTLCAALGSSFARSRPEVRDWTKAPALTEGDTLGAEWWKTAATLFAAPPKEAPQFLTQAEWNIKSCQTALGGWVLWRHAVELLGKSESHYANGGPPKLRGAVEPNPAFFRQMGALIARTVNELRRRKFLAQSPRRCAALIPEILDARRRFEEFGKKFDEAKEVEKDRLGRRHDLDLFWRRTMTAGLWRYHIKVEQGDKADDIFTAALVQLWAAANDRQWPSAPNGADVLKLFDEPTESQLMTLAAIAKRCAELADKQLAGVPFNDDDDSWFLDYGRKLAGIAGYTGDADDQPLDDAPKISDIVYDPLTDFYRLAAVGRPRALWVLYPYQGTDVLCRGAVYPYYEFDSKEKPSDEAWQIQVRAGKQPPQPEWMKPLLREGTPEKNVEK